MKGITEALAKLHDAITIAAAALAVAGLASIVGAYVFEVFTRYILNAPTSWVSDYVSYALCASVFLALPKVTKDRGHVAVTVLVDIMPRGLADAFHIVISIVGFLCLGFGAWISLQQNLRQFTRGIETLAMNPIPMWWVSAFITFGLALASLYFLRQVHPRNRILSTSGGSAR